MTKDEKTKATLTLKERSVVQLAMAHAIINNEGVSGGGRFSRGQKLDHHMKKAQVLATLAVEERLAGIEATLDSMDGKNS